MNQVSELATINCNLKLYNTYRKATEIQGNQGEVAKTALLQ